AAQSVKSKTSWVAIERGSVGFENIANTANGMDKLFSKWVVDFGAQPANHNIDNIGIDIEVDVPHMFRELFSRNNFAADASEMSQKQKFLGGKIQRNAMARSAMMAGIDFQILNSNFVRLGGSAA